MKKVLFSTLLFAILIITGCKKEECPTPETPVNLSGTTFKGSAVINTINYNPFTLLFSADGSASITIGTQSFTGSWSKTPNSSVVYFFFDESSTTKWKGQATLNAANNKLEAGTLTRTAPSTFNGTFTADKQ